MKILIVATYFPPQNSIASLRPYSWAKWWVRAGHDVTILTTTKTKRKNDFIMDFSKFTVITLPIPIISNIISFSLNENLSVNNNIKHFSIWPYIKNLFRSFGQRTGCFYTCRFPDFHDLWAKKAIKEIKSSCFDIVVSTGWPYSVHRVGLALKKKYPALKWILDWRDLWTNNHLFNGLKLFHGYERYLENKFHRNADLITTVSEPLVEILRGMTKTRVETIYNGFDPEDYHQLKATKRKENDIFTIVYTGSIYRGFQDPSPLFEAVSNLKQKGIITPDKLQIQFAGSNADVGDIAEKYGISEYYFFLGFLPRSAALQLQHDADAVLFLEYNNPAVRGILTGKIFEYLFFSKEIIAVGIDGTTSAGNLINETSTGICFGTDIKKIETYLITRVIDKIENKKVKNYDLINIYSRENQAMKMLEYIS